jgi:transmembrane sensor
MNREELIALADKILRKEASEAEIQQYNAWYNARQQGEDFDIADAEQKGADIYARVAQATKNNKVRRLWPRIAAASMSWKIAAVVAAITLGTWLYVNEIASSRKASRNDTEMNSAQAAANDIAPGRNAATLTLDNGETINLDTNKTGIVLNSDDLTYSDGTSVTSSLLSSSSLRGKHSDEAISQTLTASTPRGGTYQVVLPDGTRVWLNSASKIFFPLQFSGSQRKIILDGEAYFEVTKNKKMPFIVITDKQEVEVLGTHFNINAYAEEKDTRTTLLEGSVLVSSLRGKRSDEAISKGEAVYLKPNQQASLLGEAITVKRVDPSEVIAWKNGLFAYDHTLLGEVMRQASRWYDVTILYEDESLKQKKLSGSVTRYDNISGLLNAISYTTGVKFKIEGRKITISK